MHMRAAVTDVCQEKKEEEKEATKRNGVDYTTAHVHQESLVYGIDMLRNRNIGFVGMDP